MIYGLFAVILPFLSPIEAIVTDVEGTTTSIEFVKETLFPYAREKIPGYIEEHQNEPALTAIIFEVQEIESVDSDQVVETLLAWMDEDKKITPLKTLQGMIWEEGYRSGEIKGHVYADAAEQMKAWHKNGLKLYVYSSGSVKAQQLLFGYSCFGDLSDLFLGNFDTRIGLKRESASYRRIALEIGLPIDRILFLSDSIPELDAAREAGMQTIAVCRDPQTLQEGDYVTIHNFYELDLP